MKTTPTYQDLENEVKELRKQLSETKSEDYFKELVKNSTDAFSVIDINGNNIFQSETNFTIMGYTPKERIGKNAFEFIHPDDRDKLMQIMKSGINKPGITEKISFRAYHKNGSIKYLEGTATNRLHSPIVKGIIINYKDVTDRKLAEEALKQRENYLTALNEASLILQEGDVETQIQKFTETIGKAAHVSRTYIFKNHQDKNGKLLLSQIAEYAAPGIKPEIDNPQLQNLAYADWLPRVQKILSEGNIVNGKVADFPQLEKEILQSQEIKAILIIPIMIGKEFWGFIGFDNCINDNQWQQTEIGFLKEAAQKISYKIEKQRERNQLENENKRFIATMDSIDAIVYVADMQTHELLFLNEYAKKLFGNKIGEKCYKVIQGLENPCSFCTNNKLLDKNGKPNEPYIWEFQNTITKQWYQCRDQAIQWTDGKLVRIEIAVDITKRKKAEEALKTSEEKYKQIANQFQLMSDNIPDLVWAKDLDGNYTFANKALCEKLLIAKNPQEVIGKNDMFFVMRQRNLYPERNDWHTFGELCTNSDAVVIKSKKPERFDEYGNVKGAFLYLDVYKAPIFDEAGKMIGTVGNGRIVTKEKAAEKALKESLNQIEAINANTPNIIWKSDIDKQGNFTNTYISEVADEFLALPKGTINNSMDRYFSYIIPDYLPQVYELFKNAIANPGQLFSFSYEVKKGDGKKAWFMSNGRTIVNNNKLTGYGSTVDITERMQAEEQLHNEREKLFVTLRSIGDGVITTDTEGRVTFINSIAEQLTGWSQHDAASQPLSEVFRIINEKTGEPVENPVKKVLDSGTIIGLANHTALISRDGTMRSIADSGAPILDTQGKIIGVVLVFRDVTEKKKSEEALKEKERFLQTIFDGIQEPMHVIDRDYKVLLTNKKLLEMKNVKQEDIRGKYCYEAYQGRNEHCEQCGAKEVFKTGMPYSLIKALPLPDGYYGYFEVYSFPLLGENGKVDQVIEITRDITERKQAEEALRKSRQMNQSMLKAIPDLMFVIDRNYIIRAYNSSSDKDLYAPPEVFLGKRVDEVLPHNIALLTKVNVDKVLKSGEMSVYEYQIELAGETRFYDTRMVFQEENLVLTINRDITDRKKAEQEIRKLSEAINQSSATIVITDTDGNIEYVNPSFTKTTGYNLEEAIGANPRILKSGHTTKEEYKELWDTITAGKTWQGEFLNIKKNKEAYWEKTIITPIKNDKAEITNYIAVKEDITEKKWIDQELITAKENAEESEYKVRSMFENTQIGILYCNTEGKILEANQVMLDVLGSPSKEDSLKINLLTFKPLQDNGFARNVEKCISEKIIVTENTVYTSKWGKTVFMKYYLIPVILNNKVIGVWANFNNLTDLWNTQNELITAKEIAEENEYRLKAFIDTIPDIVCYKDGKGRWLMANKADLELFCLTGIDYYGKTDNELAEFTNEVYKEAFSTCMVSDDIAWENKKITHGIENIPTITGEIKSYDIFKIPTFYPDGRRKALAVIGRDITKLKQSENALKISEARFREFTNMLPEVVFETDKDLNITYINQNGLSKLSIVANSENYNLIQFIDIADKVKFENAQHALFNYSNFEHITVNIQRLDGSVFPAIVYLSPIRVKKSANGIRGIIAEITEFREAEQLKNDIKVAERTAAVKQQLLANISHEMRTPMNGIMGMTDFLLDTNLNEQQLEFVNTIKLSSESLLAIINDVLNLSKIEQGKMSINPEPVNLNVLLKNVINLFKSQAFQKNIELKYEIEEDFPLFVLIDVQHFRQILFNFVSNALKYTIRGKVCVLLSKVSLNDKTVQAKIEVKDTGMGIAQEHIKIIFDPFTRIEDNTFTKKTEGTGLGLAITKRLVELIGGEIGVESKLNEGSTFWFTFTAILIEQKDILSERVDVVPDISQMKLRILLAEDKKVNQMVAKMILEKNNCHVTIANNGIEVLELFARDSFDIILMDIMMPEMDGVEAMQKLRGMYDSLPPIIALSAHALEGDAARYIALGMDDYLEKPINQDKLKRTISKWMDNKRITPDKNPQS